MDCAALPRVDGFGLPADGSLLFFLDHQEDHLAGGTGDRSYARVVYVPADAATEVAEEPSIPFQQQLARDLEVDLPHLDELRAVADDLWPPDEGLASADIGGYADDEVIGSIAEQTLAGREQAGEIAVPLAQWYSHMEREKHRLTSEWVSIARFPLTDEFYYGSFVIRHDDVAAGRLDEALSVTEFSE
ncbi:DUF1963 domain-containing protein [Micromonospora sp. NPDC050784]|uniref:DUF1963 domain-containing protein n=1 Tax=Micromonospora sp. NPDC050784 TaxID=3364281 RepID=UPI003793A115